MKAKDLFVIILKVFGIYLIKDVLLAVPPVLSSFYQMLAADPEAGIFSLFISLLNLGLHVVIVCVLLFRTRFLITVLHLTSDLSEEPLVVHVHRSSVYTIAIIASGLIVLAFAIPSLAKQLYIWYEYLDARKREFGAPAYEYSKLLTALAEVLVGLLLLGNQRLLVNFIESRRRAA